MVELEHVSKYYGVTRALEDVTCRIQKGEIVGFLGPNGAGKSTAMKIITTYTAPSRGKARVGGLDVLERPLDVRRMIGYLPETVPLYDDMLVREYLEFMGQARHLNGKLKSRLNWVVEACGLESVLQRKINVLSKGFKQRTCLAQALIHDPEVLILDEPTSGLDPLQIIGIRQLIRNLAHEKTIILSTHILSEVANVADRILVVNQGRLVADGSFDDLIDQVSDKNSIYLAIRGTRKELQDGLKGIQEVRETAADSDTPRGVSGMHVYYSEKIDMVKKLNELIRERGWEVVEFHRERLSLEDSFIRLTRADSGKPDSGASEKKKGGGR